MYEHSECGPQNSMLILLMWPTPTTIFLRREDLFSCITQVNQPDFQCFRSNREPLLCERGM